ncbi:MAG: VWA domain-containing protein [Blastocatellia bacterium]|nr:VWA domain-containing protein [Blastocatellia bacterium]
MKGIKIISLTLPVVLALALLPSVTAQSHKHTDSQERSHQLPRVEIPMPATSDGALRRTSDERIKLGVDLVVLDAQVMQQKTSRVVGDLKKEDFVLLEDGVKQEITHFGQDSLPLSVILLVDRGGCLDPFGEQVRQAAADAISRLKPEDEVALMAFHDEVELIQGFRTYKRSLIEALGRVPPHEEEANHCFNRAFYAAADYMRKASNPDGRRVIILISALTKSFDCSGPSGEETRHALFESGSVVCGIIPKTALQRIENGVMGGMAAMAGLFKAKTTDVNKLAEETGGEVASAKPEVLNQAFNDLISHLRTRYSIGFVSSNTKRDGSFRKLKLELSPAAKSREGKLVVKTRRGYRAPKDRAGSVETKSKN